MKISKWFLEIVAVLIFLSSVINSWGQSRVELDARLKAVEKKLQQLDPTSKSASKASAKETPTPVGKIEPVALDKGGILLTSTGGSPTLKIGGFVEADGRFFAQPGRTFGVNSLLIRRARLDLQTAFDKTVGFRIQGDFAGSSATLKDAYAWVKFNPAIQIQAGRFKAPTGLDRLQGDPDQVFIEKALPTLLVPDRDLGVMFSAKIGDFATADLDFSNGAPDNGNLDTDTDNNKTWTGRFFVNPFAKTGSLFEGLGLGVAGAYGLENGATPSYVTSGQLTFFAYKAPVKTQWDRYRLVPQGYFYLGPIGILGEYAQSSYGLVNGSATATVVHRAWQGTASFVIGGKASYKGAAPDKPFDLDKGQLGALEVGIRAGALDIDPLAFSGGFADPLASASKAFSYGLGFNWIPRSNLKISLNWEWTEFTGGAASGNRLPEEAFLTRLQTFF